MTTEASPRAPLVVGEVPAVNDGSAAAPISLHFREIYAAELRFVWTSLYRLGVRSQDLEDVAHEVFLAVYRRLHDYDPSRPLRPWIFGFAYRSAADYRKRAHRRHEVAPDSSDFDLCADGRPTAEDEIAKRQDRALVASALESLSLEQRTVFVMVDVESWSAPEVADTLGVPLNTVYSRLRVARQAFSDAVRRMRLRGGGT